MAAVPPRTGLQMGHVSAVPRPPGILCDGWGLRGEPSALFTRFCCHPAFRVLRRLLRGYAAGIQLWLLLWFKNHNKTVIEL